MKAANYIRVVVNENIVVNFHSPDNKEADSGNDGKTTSQSGLALNGISYYGKLRRSGGSWLQNLQWCPNGQPDDGIDKKIRRQQLQR